MSGSLQAREAAINEAEIIINAKPTAVKRLAHLLCIRTKTEDSENGTRSIPTAITMAIWDSAGLRLKPNEHLFSAMSKTEEVFDSEAIAKKMNIAPITLAFTSRS